jgi:lauroyl/myristoyl acyltransferase
MTGWYSQVGFLLRFLSWIQRYQVYRPFLRLPSWWNSFFSRFFGFMFLPKIPNIKENIYAALQTIRPTLKLRRYKLLYLAIISNIAELFYYMMFILPGLSQKNIHKYVKFKNFDLLDKALAQNKGVIIPGLHIGNITHFIAGLVFNKKKIEIVVVAEFTMIRIFKNLIIRPENRNVHLIGSRSFADVKDKILWHLKQNHIVFIFYDYTSRKQLRLPFLKRLNFLKPTPQSVAALHLETGCLILPGISYPNKNMKYSIVELLDNTTIMEISKKNRTKNKKEFYSMLSLAINEVLHPYIIKYIHMWEEIVNFGVKINSNYIHFSSKTTLINLIEIIHEKILEILENSYEPSRKDTEIVNIIKRNFQMIIKKLKKPNEKFGNNAFKFKLSPSNGKGEIMNLCLLAKKILDIKSESECSELMREMIHNLKSLFT